MTILSIVILQSFFIAAAGLLVLRLAGSRPAADRSWLANVTMSAMLLSAAATLLAAPSITIHLPIAFDAISSGLRTGALDDPTASVGQASMKIGAIAQPDHLILIYLLPVAIIGLKWLNSLRRLKLMERDAAVVADPRWCVAVASAKDRLHVKREIKLLCSRAVASPVSWGFRRPVLLIDHGSARSFHSADAVAVHEVAHIARWDWLALQLSQIVTLLFWVNPLAWRLSHEAHCLREEAADDAALSQGLRRSDYAEVLVTSARQQHARSSLVHGIAPRRSALLRRVDRVLAGGDVCSPAGPTWKLGSAVSFLAIAMVLGALQLAPAQARDTDTPSGRALQEGAARWGLAPKTSETNDQRVAVETLITEAQSRSIAMGTEKAGAPSNEFDRDEIFEAAQKMADEARSRSAEIGRKADSTPGRTIRVDW